MSAKSNRLSRTLLKRYPDEFGPVTRLAHQHSFNESREFIDHQVRYQKIRQGILDLISIAEKTEFKNDRLVMATIILIAKFGRAEERTQYLDLFKNDQILIEAFRKHVALPAEIWQQPSIVAFTIGKIVLQKCRRDSEKSAVVNTNVARWLLHCLPPILSVDIALSYTEQGRFEKAQTAWKNAEVELYALKMTPIPLPSGEVIRLNGLDEDGKPARWDEQTKQTVEAIRSLIDLEFWQARARLEQSDILTKARSLAIEAQSQDSQSKFQAAFDAFEKCFVELGKIHQQDKNQIFLISSDFIDLAERYDQLAVELEREIGPQKELVNLIKNSKQLQCSAMGFSWAKTEFELRRNE